VAVHAVDIAVELGDAGQAIDLGQQVNPGSLSPERQARYWLDLAQAHTMRRQIGEALHALQEAERIAPEETRVHAVGRAVTRPALTMAVRKREAGCGQVMGVHHRSDCWPAGAALAPVPAVPGAQPYLGPRSVSAWLRRHDA
jgi:hypothetical protein